ncbi:MAG: hypothetical protein CV087_10750 [Candidatus Brocadia sp. WS118]|nr:MAG: hypothetical protein CV087_10750 [Candidatus Brocadia sp. WS118]
MRTYGEIVIHFRDLERQKGFDSLSDVEIDKEIKRLIPVGYYITTEYDFYEKAARAGRRDGQMEKSVW